MARSPHSRPLAQVPGFLHIFHAQHAHSRCVFVPLGFPGRGHSSSVSSLNDSCFTEVADTTPAGAAPTGTTETLVPKQADGIESVSEEVTSAPVRISCDDGVNQPVVETSAAIDASIPDETHANLPVPIEVAVVDVIPPPVPSLAGVWEFCAKLESVRMNQCRLRQLIVTWVCMLSG